MAQASVDARGGATERNNPSFWIIKPRFSNPLRYVELHLSTLKDLKHKYLEEHYS